MPFSSIGAISKESHVKLKVAIPRSPPLLWLHRRCFAAAQSPSGGTSAIASIPGSVVRGAEQGQPVTPPGIINIIASPTPPSSNAGSKQKTTRRGESHVPSK